MSSLKSKIIGTLLLGIGWFVFIVLYLAFFAGGFDFWQKLAIFVSSAAIVIGIVAIMWIRWAVK